MERKSLTDILHGTERDILARAWESTEAAADFGPLPGGTYTARVVSGELVTAKTTGTPGYKLTFRVLDGELANRQFWHDVWLTAPALPMAKRDLGKLGITSLEQLETPLPPGIRVRAKVVLRREDSGEEYNRVRSFEVVGVDSAVDEAFGPNESPEAGDATDVKDDGEGERETPEKDLMPPQETKRESDDEH